LEFNFDSFLGHMAEGYGLRDNARAEDKKLADSIRGDLLPHQLAVVTDPCRNKAVLCPRQAGKSYTAMSYAFDTALRIVGAKVVIVNLSLRNAKDVYWYEMAIFASKHGVQCKFFQNELRTVLPNGSQILLTSADSRAEIEKLRGSQFNLAIIDECKSYSPPLLKELIYEVLKPALAKRKGTLLMIGTPGNILQGPFFETTYPGFRTAPTKKHPEGKLVSRDFNKPEAYWADNPKDRTFWSRHYWSTEANSRQPQIWLDFLEQKEINGWADDEPIWRREALGEWIATSDAFVYAYANLASTDPGKVQWVPDFKNGNKWGLAKDVEWRYLLGIDFGYEDAFAMVVCAYNVYDKKLYHVWDYKESHLDVYQVIGCIESAIARFGQFDTIVAEYSTGGKNIIEALNKKHGLSIKCAEKQHKFDFIEQVNADFRAGWILIQPKSDLAFELETLQLDLSKGTKEQLARAGKLREAPSLPNDLCDAFLYLWRYSYHYFAEQRPSVFEPGTAGWFLEQEKKAMLDAIRRRAEERTRPEWHKWTANRDPFKEIAFGHN